MADLENIKAGTQILSSDGQLLGFVDDVEGGERLRMSSAGGADTTTSDFIPSSWVEHVTDGIVRLNRSETDVRSGLNEDIPAGDETS
ncbi:DUF2171 domain-containing protein [Rhizosaccharibacter radicis]|uniref:DUF2171 domain-containing protein n=1 Tax=Rhizosaccharibacter radicis TaxID=2782605 RepID=A0ABT1VTK8_9PROT|nr:DUF2171 domain-containing protein [Acetobacteraceae bacterium KSS12]